MVEKSFGYPKECIEIENQIIDLIHKLNNGDDLVKASEELKQVETLIPKMNSIEKKYPECKTITIPLSQKLVTSIDKFIEKEKKKDEQTVQKNKGSSAISVDVVSYDDWFTLIKTGIRNGKKYSFIACVNGVRNSTSSRCHSSGSEAKRIFYNTDDISDLETKKKWVNTINKYLCVTAYVTGAEAFIVNIEDEIKCK